MAEADEFSRLSIHESFCVSAKSWEVQQGVQMLTCKHGNPKSAPDCTPSPVREHVGIWDRTGRR